MGLKEHIVFPEIDYDKVDHLGHGRHRLHDGAKRTTKPRALLALFNFPFRNQ
jgi:large subunit ribosomal protein L5